MYKCSCCFFPSSFHTSVKLVCLSLTTHTHTHTHTHIMKVAKGRGDKDAHKYSFPSRVVDERVVCAKKHTYLHLKINMC